MRKRIKGATTRAEAKRTFLNVEMDPQLRWQLRQAAAAEGRDLKDWLSAFLRRHLETPARS